MPKNTTPAIADSHRLCSRMRSLFHSKILVILCEDFICRIILMLEKNEISYNIQQPMLLQHAFHKRLVICILRRLIRTICRFPFLIPRFSRSNSSHLRSRKIRNNIENIVHEKLFDIVLIVFDLPVSARHIRI